MKVLLVDNGAKNRSAYLGVLEGLGHDVTAVDDGPDALELLRQGIWDLVLVDLDARGASDVDALERACALVPEALRLLVGNAAASGARTRTLRRGRVLALIERPDMDGASPFGVIAGSRPGTYEVRFAED